MHALLGSSQCGSMLQLHGGILASFIAEAVYCLSIITSAAAGPRQHKHARVRPAAVVDNEGLRALHEGMIEPTNQAGEYKRRPGPPSFSLGVTFRRYAHRQLGTSKPVDSADSFGREKLDE